MCSCVCSHLLVVISTCLHTVVTLVPAPPIYSALCLLYSIAGYSAEPNEGGRDLEAWEAERK